jgi:UDP-glucose 4-epimerase
MDAALLPASAIETRGSGLNIGCGASHSALDLIAAVEKASGRTLQPRFGPARPGDDMHSRAKIDCARARLGCEALAFDDGVGMTHRALIGG